MPLSMTKVAFGASSFEDLHGWFKTRRDQARLTTRYLPKRHEEMIGGSVYWILKHQLIARSEILAFEESADAQGLPDPQTGRKYRRAILEAGGSRPAMESFKAFRGREPQLDALLRHQGMAAPASTAGKG